MLTGVNEATCCVFVSLAAAAGGFGTATGGLFGQAAQPQAASLFKPFGQATTTQSTGFSFGNTNTMGQANTSSMVGCFVSLHSFAHKHLEGLIVFE